MNSYKRIYRDAQSLKYTDKIKLLFHRRKKSQNKEYASSSVRVEETKDNSSETDNKIFQKDEIEKIVDLEDTLEFGIDNPNEADISDVSDFGEMRGLLTPEMLDGVELPEPPPLPEMLRKDRKDETPDDSHLEKDDTQGLPSFIITDCDKISDSDRMFKYKTTVCLESFRTKIDSTDIASGKKAFRFKDTDCILDKNEETPVIVSDYNEEVVVLFARPDVYYRTKNEPREYPCKCRAVLDDVTLDLFAKYKKEEELVEAVKIFNRLTPKQQAYIRNQSSKPPVKELDTNTEDDVFTPIQDQGSLEMMYKICRDTYSAETRARIDTLFAKLHTHHFSGETKADIVTQLSYALCIDTDALQHRHKTYDEIMKIFDKYVYGMKALKERIAEYILAMQYSGANYFCILLVGSPGVGKTSVCEAISEILDCDLAHVDCSGVDSVGLCGLVKSYGGAQPSKISNVLLEKGKADLLLRLDEIDKLVKDKNGDAFSALIKPFGPQRVFHDEYLDGDIDMSNTKIICTANDISKIPGYILNRFGDNVFYIPDYDTKDKAEIAKHYIISRKMEEYKIKEDELIFSNEAIEEIAANYCFDSGAREITAYVESLIRKAIKGWSRGTDPKPLLIDVEYVKRNLRRNDNGRSRKHIGFTC